MSIIIQKSNKLAYDNLKIFWPNVLLNILGKLIKKVISNRLLYSILHMNQLGSIRQQLTTDAGIFLTYFI